jgi:Ner family transcriptional regulator
MTPQAAEKKPAPTDWHNADVIAALHKAGWSFVQLSLAHGLGRQCLNKVLHRPYPKAERIVAEVLGMKPEDIWPSRYDSNGLPNRPFGRPPLNGRPAAASVAPLRRARNVSGKAKG